MSYFNNVTISGSVGILQDEIIDANNTKSGSVLTVGEIWTGASSYLRGFSSIRVVFSSDQNCIIYVEQSIDGTNWDIDDAYKYYIGVNSFSRIVKIVGSWLRIRVKNNGIASTTYFRIQTSKYPIDEALPRSLNDYGRLKTSTGIIDEETNTRVEVEPLGSLKTVTPVRLIGTGFSGSTLDPNFWTAYTSASGAVTQSGELIITSASTSASSIARVTSNRRARKIPGATNQFRAVIRHITTPQANSIRRIGVYDENDGFYFQLNGSTLGVGSRKAGIDTIISSGSFNGNYGSSVITNSNLRRLVINYSSISAKFFIDDVLLHTLSNVNSPSLTNTLNLPIRAEVYNTGSITYSNDVEIRFACVVRLGELYSNPQYKYIGTDSTNILKYSAGTLHNIVNTDNAGNISIYDSIGAVGSSGSTIAYIDSTKVVGSLKFDLSFSNGLTIVTTGGAKCTVSYD